MIEIKDLDLLYGFINGMSEKGYECEFSIDIPALAQKDYADGKENKIKTKDIKQQVITIILSKGE